MMAGVTPQSEGTDEASIRLLVENAVLRDDVAPLLRILFSFSTATAVKDHDAATSAAAGEKPTTSVPQVAGPPNSPPPSTAQVAVADGKRALAVISRCLESVAAEQEQVIQDICNANALEIAGFVSDMHSMQQNAAHMQELMIRGNQVLQGSGHLLMGHAHALSELVAVQDNVVGGLAGVRGAQRLLRSCLQVGALLEERQLYQALRMIHDIQSNQLAALLAMLAPPGSSPSPATAGMGAMAAQPGGAGGGPGAVPLGRSLANMVSLRAFFESLVAELIAAVEALAISEVHTWLVSARSLARPVGLRAVRKAAIQRQLEEDLARERLRLGAQLMLADTPLSELCSSVVSTPFRADLQADTTWPSTRGAAGGGAAAPERVLSAADTGAAVIRLQGVIGEAELQVLHPGAPQAAVSELVEKWGKQQRRRTLRHSATIKAGAGGLATAAGAAASQQGPGTLEALGSRLCVAADTTVPLLSGLPMRGLLRCAHIHEVLGRTSRLRDYYVEQRRLQIAADLAAPHVPFLENYQAYLGQVVGFFVIESCVARLLPDLVHTTTAEMLWEGAAAQIKAVLERVLCSPGAPGLLAAPRSIRPSGGDAGALPGRDVGDPGSTPPIMVLVKDFVMLACDAFEAAACSPGVIEDVLMTASHRYHELLTADAAAEAHRIITDDPLAAEVVVSTPSAAEHLCVTLGLPARLDNAFSEPTAGGSAGPRQHHGSGTVASIDLPPLPFTAPFTPLVPALLKVIRGYVEDSASYLRGLLPPWEMEEALTQARDRMIVKVVVEGMLGRVNALATSSRVAESMRLVSDAWALVRAARALDMQLGAAAAPLAERDPEVQKWTRKAEARRAGVGVAAPTAVQEAAMDNRRKREPRASDLGSGLSAAPPAPSLSVSLHQIQDGAERAVLRQVAARVDALLSAGFRTTPWTPTTPLPPGPSEHVMPLIAYLQDCFESARRALPRVSWAFLMRTVLKSIAISYMKLFSPDGIKGYNLLVLETLAYDISAFQNFSARAAAPPAGQDAASGVQPLVGMPQQFAEPEQLFRLLLSSQLEDVLVPELRRQRYPNLEPSTIVLALDKYKELLKVGKEKTPFPTRKMVDGIAKALRGQMVVGTAATVLQGF